MIGINALLPFARPDVSTISPPPTSLTGTATGSALPDPFRLSVIQYDAMIEKDS